MGMTRFSSQLHSIYHCLNVNRCIFDTHGRPFGNIIRVLE